MDAAFSKCRGRFAPSPTGLLHLGNARSALLGWLQARCEQGSFLLRMEDLDAARCRPAFVDNIFEDLRWLGLVWDEPVLFQSQRLPLYEEALKTLRKQDLVYPCFCTRGEIARAVSAPHGLGEEGPRYPGTCASLSSEQAAERSRTRSPAYRFRTQPGTVTFEDGLAGPYAQEVWSCVGDFVVSRNDGVPSYQLAVVVDDAATHVTHVLRGEDLLSSTPRQLQLYAALALTPPRFFHVPLIMGEDGKRLAKREGAFALSELRHQGVPAERVLGLLAAASGLGEGEPLALSTLLQRYAQRGPPRESGVLAEHTVRAALGLIDT